MELRRKCRKNLTKKWILWKFRKNASLVLGLNKSFKKFSLLNFSTILTLQYFPSKPYQVLPPFLKRLRKTHSRSSYKRFLCKIKVVEKSGFSFFQLLTKLSIAAREKETKQNKLFFSSPSFFPFRFVAVSFLLLKSLFFNVMSMLSWLYDSLLTYDFSRVSDNDNRWGGIRRKRRKSFLGLVFRTRQHLKRLWFNFPSCSFELVFHFALNNHLSQKGTAGKVP